MLSQNRVLSLFLGVFFISLQASAQSEVMERAIKLDKKREFNGFQITLNAPEDVVKAAVEKKLKSMSIRYKESRGIYTAVAAVVGSISEKTMDLTVLVDEDRKSKTVTIGTICQVGYDLVFNSRDNPVEAQNIRNFLVGLKEDVRVEYLNFRIKEEGEKLADMEKSLKKLESKKTGLEKDIESYQKKIEDAKNDIAKTTTEIENTKTQIEGQRRNIENVKKEF